MSASGLTVMTVDFTDPVGVIERWTAQHLPESFDDGSRPLIKYLNDSRFDPPEQQTPRNYFAESWYHVKIYTDVVQEASLGPVENLLYRGAGTVILECCTPTGIGSGTARKMATIAARIYRGQTLGVSGLMLRAPYTRETVSDGNWFQINLVVPFTWDGRILVKEGG